ncbi:heavy chain kinase a [Anaeramoeba flamelloides]|uniref:Heavy chain kinase a n=1 Tax=Anaeramoeba flamelloides TaxID=1746091 RepID=A0ABQ8Y8D0_9EUKA|nr:heavy chain kinase a [Anaeramoeba flamelloides]
MSVSYCSDEYNSKSSGVSERESNLKRIIDSINNISSDLDSGSKNERTSESEGINKKIKKRKRKGKGKGKRKHKQKKKQKKKTKKKKTNQKSLQREMETRRVDTETQSESSYDSNEESNLNYKQYESKKNKKGIKILFLVEYKESVMFTNYLRLIFNFLNSLKGQANKKKKNKKKKYKGSQQRREILISFVWYDLKKGNYKSYSFTSNYEKLCQRITPIINDESYESTRQKNLTFEDILIICRHKSWDAKHKILIHYSNSNPYTKNTIKTVKLEKFTETLYEKTIYSYFIYPKTRSKKKQNFSFLNKMKSRKKEKTPKNFTYFKQYKFMGNSNNFSFFNRLISINPDSNAENSNKKNPNTNNSSANSNSNSKPSSDTQEYSNSTDGLKSESEQELKSGSESSTGSSSSSSSSTTTSSSTTSSGSSTTLSYSLLTSESQTKSESTSESNSGSESTWEFNSRSESNTVSDSDPPIKKNKKNKKKHHKKHHKKQKKQKKKKQKRKQKTKQKKRTYSKHKIQKYHRKRVKKVQKEKDWFEKQTVEAYRYCVDDVKLDQLLENNFKPKFVKRKKILKFVKTMKNNKFTVKFRGKKSYHVLSDCKGTRFIGTFLSSKIPQDKMKTYFFTQMRRQAIAKKFANLFNHNRPFRSIQFIEPIFCEFERKDEFGCGLIEKCLEGEFLNFSKNLLQNDKRAKKRIFSTLYTFSHFVYQNSDPKILIDNFKGILTQPNDSAYLLTNPKIHTKNENIGFGKSNKKGKAFKDFQKNHICSSTCRRMHLDPFKNGSKKIKNSYLKNNYPGTVRFYDYRIICNTILCGNLVTVRYMDYRQNFEYYCQKCKKAIKKKKKKYEKKKRNRREKKRKRKGKRRK